MNSAAPSGNPDGWRAVLREAVDAGAKPLASDDAVAMRRAVVAAARDVGQGPRRWRPLALAATVLLMIGLGTAAGLRFQAVGRRVDRTGRVAPVPAGEQRQLQFATPGGTRIIWVFNSELDLKAATP